MKPVAWAACGGACAVPSDLSGVTAVAAGSDFSLALKDDGTVVAWGCGFNFGECAVPGGLSDVTAVAAGHFHSLALKGDGTVTAWGCGGGFDYGQCTVPSGLSGVTAVSAAVSDSLALKSDGTVVAWGCAIDQDHGQCSVPAGLTGVIAIAAGSAHSLALKRDGSVVAWGCGPGFDYEQCTVPVGLTGVTAIAAGHTQSLALKGDGSVVAWGCGAFDYGQCTAPVGLSGVVAIAAGYGQSLALRSDGTVVGWGCAEGFNFGQCSAPRGLARVKAVSAGDFHSLALAQWIDQFISFDPLADRSWGELEFPVSATASSGLPVSFGASGNCFIASSVLVRFTSAGSCTVTASQAGGLNYNPAPAVSRTFAITKVQQSIIFGTLADETFGAPDFTVTASESLTLPVRFSASGNCAVNGATVHLTGAGSCTITASGEGNVDYDPPPDVSRTFAIAKARQAIIFGLLANETYGAPDFTVTATASSGLAISLVASGSCTVDGATVHLTGAGLCTITASGEGNVDYDPPSDLSRTFAIARAQQSINFGPLADRSWGELEFPVSATASSGLPVSFGASGNCFIASGALVRFTSAGSCTVTASQAGSLNYNPAPPLSRTFAIAQVQQSISFGPLAKKTFGAPDFTVTATASSGLAVSFAASGSCTVRGANVHLTGPGSCGITASQAGNGDYTAASEVSQIFKIAPTSCRVPNVVGKRVASARLRMAEGHCRTGRVGHAYSRKRPRGIVISQSRPPGRVLPARSKIDIIVSRGPRR